MSYSKLSHKYKFVLFLLFSFHFSYTLAQTTTLLPSIENVIPPSPNVSAINKFGNIPVGPSTGIPNIGVPIYTWTGKNFGKSFSISLEYHNGGVKVEETPSNIGLGWALNAGGVISRTMRGVYDELPENGFLYRAMPASSYEGNTYDVPNNERLFFRMNAGLVDTQNDIFNYNFNGQSGRFVLGRNGDILFLEQTKLKVEKFIDIIDGKPLFSKFIITDEYGFKYLFEDYELSSRTGGQGPSSIFTSAWYLSKVINPTGNDTVEFQYENITFRNNSGLSGTIAQPLFADGYGLYAQMSGGSATDIFAKRLKTIIFTDGNAVNFYYDSAERNDLPGDFLLKKIKISKGDKTFGYQLTQDYSLSGRATLLSVTPLGGQNEIADKPYLFEYVTHPVLPGKMSAEQDHWGYANYNPTGDFYPHEYFRAPGGAYNPWREFGGGNRDTDYDRVRAGSMTKITYPTGGYTIFDMEANTAKDNWLEQNEAVTVTNPPYTDRSMSEGLNSDLSPAANIPFVFQGESNTNTSFEVTVNPLGGTCSSGCAIRLEFYNSSNANLSTQQVNFSDPSPDPYQITKHFVLSNLIKNQTYYIKAYTVNLTGYYEYIQINWRETNAGGSSTVTLSHVQPFVGGLRAKKITDFTDNQTALTKEYEYVNEDGVTSSGALGFRPVYTYLVRYQDKTTPDSFEQPFYFGNFDYNYAIRSTSTVNDIAYANSSPVTYKRVVEKITANGQSLGKTVRYFTNFTDSHPVVQDVFPPIPTQFTPWSLGLLQKEEIYNGEGVLLKQTENSYTSHADNFSSDPQRVENFRSISIAPVRFSWNGSPFTPHVTPNSEPHYFLSSNFSPVSGRTELSQTTTKEYKTGQSPIISSVSYTYDSSEFYLKEAITTNSRSLQRKLVTEYPKDRMIAGPNAGVFASMYEKNMIRNIIGERQYVNNVQHMYQWRDYAALNSALFVPSTAHSKFQEEADEVRVRFTDYDSHGALVSVKQENGVSICYIWGYGGDYLVAKLTNVDYSTVKSILGGTQAVEDFRNQRNPSDALINTFVDNLRNNLPQVQIESFTYNTLVGITTHADATRKKIFYDYDDFGRLKWIKDQDGNIVKENQYHYKN